MVSQEQSDALRDADHGSMMKTMLGSPQGRQYIWEALEACGVFRSSFAGEQPHTTAFHEGRRDIGLRLLADVLTFDANALTVMRAEDTERQMRYHVITPERDADE